jgi:hypothetical protein
VCPRRAMPPCLADLRAVLKTRLSEPAAAGRRAFASSEPNLYLNRERKRERPAAGTSAGKVAATKRGRGPRSPATPGRRR